jgi:4-amino-4-deoxy-L-arabinose transferase-like glycosyltransferase
MSLRCYHTLMTNGTPAVQPHRVDRRRDALLLTAIVLAAFGLRVAYIIQLSHNPEFDHPTMDALYHDQWARAIAAGKTYMEGPYFRAPLYPAFLAGIYKLTGGSYWAPRIVQAVLGSLSCGLLFIIGRVAFGRAVGAVAGLVAATYWILIYFDGELLITSLIVFLELVVLLLLVLGGRHPRTAVFAAAGLVLGLSAVARPNILLFAPFVVLWLLVLAGRRWGRGIAHALCFCAAVLVPILPITIRNYIVGGDEVLISSQGGVNFYIGNNPLSDGKTAIVPGTPGDWWGGYYATIERAEEAMGRKLKPSEVSRYYYDQAWQFIREHPRDAATLTLRKLRLFWIRWEISNNQDIYFWTEQFTPFVRWLPVGFWLVGPLGLLGLALCWPRGRELFPLWGFVLVYMVSVVAFFCTARYRVPVIPPLILLGAYAVFWLVKAVRHGRWDALGGALVVLVPAALAVNITYGAPHRQHDSQSYWRLAKAYERAGRPGLAIAAYHDAIRSYDELKDPDLYVAENPFVYLSLARLLSTTPRADLRNGHEALALVEHAARLLRPDHPLVLDTRAAALAELGDFDAAAATAREALAKAIELGWTENAESIREHLNAYEAGRPFR